MNEQSNKEKLTLSEKIKRWFMKYLKSDENCSKSCSNCVYCPYVQDSKYTFVIRKREERH